MYIYNLSLIRANSFQFLCFNTANKYDMQSLGLHAIIFFTHSNTCWLEAC